MTSSLSADFDPYYLSFLIGYIRLRAVTITRWYRKKGIVLPDFPDKSVFIAAGKNDPICSPMESTELQSLFEKANAKVEIHWENRGHQLTVDEVEAAAHWYRRVF